MSTSRSEDLEVEPGGLQVSVLDAVLLAGLVVVVVAVLVRFRRKRLEEQNNLRNLRVITK
jgi:hypothetical protein